MPRYLAALLFAASLLFSTGAQATCNGQFPANTVCGNPTGSTGNPNPVPLSSFSVLFANPTAHVGLSTVNGSATTAMRSDASPPLDQSISPTWTGTHTFTNSLLRLLGSSTGHTTFTSANSGASNFTLTFPAVTDTLAALGTAQTWSALQQFNDGDFALKGSASGTLVQHAAAAAGSSVLTWPAGTTDFTATGSAHYVVRQSSAGSALTVGQLACSDLSDSVSGCSGTASSITVGNPVIGGTNSYLLGISSGGNLASQQFATLAQGGLGGDQSAAAANSVSVFPGSGGAAVPTTLASIFASPPPIGSTTPNTGAFTTLAASNTVSGTGFSTYLASPPPIGTTASNTGAFSALGIGITSPPIPFDLEAPSSSAAWPSSAYVPVLGKAVSNITTDSHPTVGISRWETLAGINTSAGQNAALFVTAFGNNTVPASTVSQTAALTAYASQVGIGDVVGNYSISTQSGGLHSGTGYTAYSYFGAVNVTTTQGSAIALETNVANNSGADYPLSAAAFGTGLSVGIDNVAAGTYLNSAGYWNRSNAGAMFDAGYVNLAGSIKTYGFIDQSSSVNVLVATGTHTTGIDMSTATISGNFLVGPSSAFKVTAVGVVQSAGFIQTAAAPTVAAAQIGYGSTTAAAANCNVTSPTPTGCVVINVAGTTRYIPYY